MKKQKQLWMLTLVMLLSEAILIGLSGLRIFSIIMAFGKVDAYEDSLQDLPEEELEAELEKAREYNETLADGKASSSSYESCLNINGDGMMGWLEIPAIGVRLPVFHGTSSDVLKTGAGHLETSSLPVGGSGSHTVIAGHSGLPGNELLTCLDELETGDIFYLHVLGLTLCYEVIRTEVVLPAETASLQIVEGEDLCTLVTCTPYGINTHRLLVTGARTDEAAETTTEALWHGRKRDAVLLAAAILELMIYLRFRRDLKKT